MVTARDKNLGTVKIFFFLFRDIERRPFLLRLLSFSAVQSALHRQYLKCVCKKTRRFRRVFLFVGIARNSGLTSSLSCAKVEGNL